MRRRMIVVMAAVCLTVALFDGTANARTLASPEGIISSEEIQVIAEMPAAEEEGATADEAADGTPAPQEPSTTGTAIGTTGAAAAWYTPKNPMKKEHQKLLWDYCQQRNLDYIDMLTLIGLESNFNEKCSTGRYKGYFQISTTHSADLSKRLKTANKPLDGAININWGTYMFSQTLADDRLQDLEGSDLRDAALSLYQRGTGGYDKYGINQKYLDTFYKRRKQVEAWFS